MGGRLYDPELEIFLSPDPLVAEPFSAQGWNPYAYMGNCLLSRVDPTSHQQVAGYSSFSSTAQCGSTCASCGY